MSRKDRSFSNNVGAFVVGILCLLPIFAGATWGVISALVIIPAIVLLFAVVYYCTDLMDDITGNDFVYGLIGFAVIIFVLVCIGSCFHGDPKSSSERYIERRSNMGLPMY